MFDAVSFCKNYGIPYTFRGKNVSIGWVGLNCPFHKDDASHLGYNLAGGYFYCWKCGGHSIASVIMEFLQCDYYTAAGLIEEYESAGSLSLTLNKKKAEASSITLPGDNLTRPYRKYLSGRGFDPDIAVSKYHVRAGGIVGDWKYRLIIPVYQNHILVTYQGRDITGNSDLRYKTLAVEKSVVNPKDCLYNLDFVEGFESIGVNEGVFDSWKLGDGFVATLGTSTTEEQVRKLSKYNNVYIVFDPEPMAQERARKLAERVSAMGGKHVEVIDTGLDHDPGDMTSSEVRWFRKELGF